MPCLKAVFKIPQIDGNDDFSDDDEPPNKKLKSGEMKAKNLTQKELDTFLKSVSTKVKMYGGNLKREKGFFVLKDFYVCIREAKSDGVELSKLEAENLVFVKYIRTRDSHTLCCLRCYMFADQMIKMNPNIIDINKADRASMIRTCVHTIVVESLNLGSDLEAKNKESANLTVINDRPKIALVFSHNDGYGLVQVNNVQHSTTAKCFWPHNNSRGCDHVQNFLRETKGERVPKTVVLEDEDIVEETKPDIFDNPIKVKLKWPIGSSDQEFFRDIENHKFSELMHLVPPVLKNIKCPHGNFFNPDNPVDRQWIVTRNVRIFHIGLVERKSRIVYFRPTHSEGNPCKCRQTYTGEEDMLLVANTTPYMRGTNAPCDLISYPLLNKFTNMYGMGTSLRTFHQSIIDEFQDWGFDQNQVISWESWRLGVWKFWGDVLELDALKLFTCPDCGPRPKVLVADGITLGVQIKQLKESKLSLTVPYNSSKILSGSKHKNRMFIKFFTNRKLLKTACLEKKWPIINKIKSNDEGMELVVKYVRDQKIKLRSPNSNDLKLLWNISTKTSSTSLFQEIDLDLLNKLKDFLSGTHHQGMFNSFDSLELASQLNIKYPVIVGILRSFCAESEKPSKGVTDLLLGLINHTEKFWFTINKDNSEQWVKRESGEIISQFYPNFPLLFERAKYDNECKQQDDKAWLDLCEKSFPEHVKLSPGLFLLTCACAHKTVYGFSFMTTNESPGMLFDIDQCRFPRDYKPTLVYDASCKAKEYGLNRDPERWMALKVVTDPFHQPNHTNCCEAFKSTEYSELNSVNCEAAEQFNARLRDVHDSLVMMAPDHYMRALSIFIGYKNNKCHLKF